MYTDVTKFKTDIKTAFQSWGESKIDELFAGKPMVKHYAKKGLTNWLSKTDGRMNRGIDSMLMFITDEHGNIDFDTLFDDVMCIFKDMDIANYELPMGVKLSYGKGELCFDIPNNPLLNIFFGDLGKVRFSAADFEEIKALIK